MLRTCFNFNFVLKVIVFKLFSLIAGAAIGQAGGSYEQFWIAIQRDQVAPIQALQARGFDINSTSPSLSPPLVHALHLDNKRVALYLAAQPELDLEAINEAGENALMMAALRGHLDLVELLIQRRAQVNKPGWAPLHYAATYSGNNALAIVRLLLEHHAFVDAESPNRSTPLMLAAQYGSEPVVQLLLEEGAQPLQKNQLGLTAIDFARRAGREPMAQLIARFARLTRPPAATGSGW
jgi:ankyrin repeat protein